MRSKALINNKNDDKYCFIWSTLASLLPCNTNPNRVPIYRQNFNQLNIQVFDFTKGFKCSDVYKVEKLNKLSFNLNELNFYQDDNKWKHKLIPLEISKKDYVKRVFDSAIF